MPTILIVDDEPDILEFVTYNLKKDGYTVYSASDGKKAMEMAHSIHPDLIILDIMMGGMDGVEVCRKLREEKEFENTFILFLTARSEEYSELAGFNVGADDYITKPVRPRVLSARINALLKRKQPESEIAQPITLGELKIFQEQRIVQKNNTEIFLPKKEFDLLVLLISKPGKVFTREEIYSKIWGNDVIVGDRTLDVHIRKLREKIGEKYIKTRKGTGYSFDF